MVTVLPPAVTVSGLEPGSDAAGFTNETGVDVPVAPGAILNDNVARAPLPMLVVLIPETMHRMSPAEMMPHRADLPAPLAPGPVTKKVPAEGVRFAAE